MESFAPTRRWVLGALLAKATGMAASDKAVLTAVREMEGRDGLKLVRPGRMYRGPLRDADRPEGRMVGVRAISPDAVAIVYWSPLPARGDRPPRTPFLIVEGIADGPRPISLEGQGAYLCGLAAGPKVIVVMAVSFVQRGRRSLLALDLRSGMTVHDLTPYVTRFEPPDLERISVSGPGTLVALGSREQLQVIEIPSGMSAYEGPGRFPKLSPDGKRLAFIEREQLYIRSLADGSSRQLLPGKRVMGSGGLSPDGRFLTAGAWTTELAFEKRQIVIDTGTGDYSVLGKLGEGNYGDDFAWISTKLLTEKERDNPAGG